MAHGPQVMVLSDEEADKPAARRQAALDLEAESQLPGPSGKQMSKKEAPSAQRLQTALAVPSKMLIVQLRRRVAHAIAVDEINNEPVLWRTECGWGCVWSRFYRVAEDGLGPQLRRCRRCFADQERQASSSSSSSSSSDSSSS